MIPETIAVHRAKRLDFGNQMATFPKLWRTLDLNLDQFESAWKPDPALHNHAQ
jgi:hypothetical protein